MIDEVALMARITNAHAAVEMAQRDLAMEDDGSIQHLQAQIRYLQAKVHHLTLLAVLQGGQQQRLWQELHRLSDEIAQRRTH